MNRKIIAILTGISLAFLLSETGIRIYEKIIGTTFSLNVQALNNQSRHPKGMFHQDPVLGIGSLTPHFVGFAVTSDFQVKYQTNDYGFRDDEFNLVDSGKFRILALGDSFTFGEGVDVSETFVAKTENMMKNVDIYNMGVPGYGLHDIEKLLVYYLPMFKPEAAIVFVNKAIIDRSWRWYLASDPYVDKHRKIETTTVYIDPDKQILTLPDIGFLAHSELYQFFQYKLSLQQHLAKMRDNERLAWNAFFKRDTHVLGIESSGGISRKRQFLVQLMTEIGRIAEVNKSRLIIVNINPESLGEDIDLDKIFSGNFIDLSNDISVYRGQGHELSFTVDPHYNKKTHSFIAKLLAPMLQKKLHLEVNNK